MPGNALPNKTGPAIVLVKIKNDLGASRTRNLLLRKQVLYPLSYEVKSEARF